jgi:PAS domain S-box-containing protein
MKAKGASKVKPPDSEQHPEDELAEFQAKFRVLFENVSSGVAVYEARNDGEDFVFVDFNPAGEEIDRIKKEELIGKSVAEVFPGVKEFGLFDVFRRVYKTGTPEHHPVSIYKDNRVCGWRENYVYKLPSGHVVAIYDDVTEQKRSELAARMSEQCFQAIANYTYDWEVWVSPTGRVLWTNPAVKRVTGYDIRELMAMTDYPKSIIYIEDRDRMGRAFRSALGGSTGNDVQFRIKRRDHKVIWAEMSWQPIYDETRHPLGHRQSIRDVTARKKAEEALEKAEQEKEAILDSLTELVAYQDRDMTILWANRAACESANLRREELIGRHCYQIWGEGDRVCSSCPVARAMETGRPEEGERVSPDGRAWLIKASPVRNECGSIVGAVEVTLDITERKLAVGKITPQ